MFMFFRYTIIVCCFLKNNSFRYKCYKNNNNNKLLLKKNSEHICKPKTYNQYKYFTALNKNEDNIVVVTGPAGTGKTLIACNTAINNLKSNKIEKIIITRPVVSVEEEIGFLPGNLNKKMEPWTKPIFDIFEENYSKKNINNMMLNGQIEISPLAFMRGRTFKNSIIIADEMQNSTPNQMFMLLTRIGDKSKMIITGDPLQSVNKNNGLVDIITKFNNNYYSEKELVEVESSDEWLEQ